MTRWLRNIADYWRFVSRRRTDRSQPVFPIKITVFVGVLLLIMPVVTVLLIDPIYRSQFLMVKSPPHTLWEAITEVGKSDWVLTLCGAVLILLSIASADRFHREKKILWHRIYLNMHYLFTTVAFSGLTVLMLKAVFSRTRPEFLSGPGVWESRHWMFAYEYSSFPSGHSTTAGAMAMGLSLMFPRLVWFFLPAGFLIALSRNAVFAHFPSDSVAGLLFGLAFSYFYARYFARKRLLFKFGKSGRLGLRGEGRHNMGLFSSIKTQTNS